MGLGWEEEEEVELRCLVVRRSFGVVVQRVVLLKEGNCRRHGELGRLTILVPIQDLTEESFR